MSVPDRPSLDIRRKSYGAVINDALLSPPKRRRSRGFLPESHDEETRPNWLLRLVVCVTLLTVGALWVGFRYMGGAIEPRNGEQSNVNAEVPDWKEWSARFSANSEHLLASQISTHRVAGFLQLSCYSTANMHLLGTLPTSGAPVLVACPKKCATHTKVVQLEKQHGAGVWSQNGHFVDHSFVCIAAEKLTDIDGGLFVLLLGNMPNGQRSFSIKKSAHPYSLDVDKDGTISEAEAAGVRDLFEGVAGTESLRYNGMADFSVEVVSQMDTDNDDVVSEQEHIKWMAEQLTRTSTLGHPEL
jgi:hypothetical protein